VRRVLAALVLVSACSGGTPVETTQPTPSTVTTTTVSTTTTSIPSSTTTVPATTTTIPLDELELTLHVVASGFGQPVYVTNAGDDRLFVVDQPGYIWVIDGADPLVFLDLTDEVVFEGERGLLGMAFHPEYEENGLFYVNFTDRDGGTTKIVEFAVSDDPNVADPASAREILSIEQPAPNHNGGMVQFGPDGSLWIGMGDGGGANDQFGNGQDAEAMLGSMLRITVGPGIETYEIPEGNEFASPEIWSKGMRNPWRFAFDGDDLWIADVGQELIEEVNRVSWAESGLNFGWPIMEGSTCFQADTCDTTGLVLPVTEYGHGEGCSITGGFVYRGQAIPQLDGHYFYSDFCTGFLRSITADATEHDWTPQVGELGRVTSFGQDAAGELYVTVRQGAVLRLEPSI
jgi:glucose/arabinose dehydrogenase